MNYRELMNLFLDFGEAMMSAGGEISRTEDSIARMGMAYGAIKTNVFAITSSIVVTMTFKDGVQHTQTRRVLTSSSTDFQKLEALNSLSRKCSEKAIPANELKKEIEEINRKSVGNFNLYLGSILAAGGFAMFFGGNVFDAVFAAIFAVLICFMQQKVAPVFPNKVLFYFVCALITGFGIHFFADFIPLLNSDKIIIGDIMLLIPGIAITNAVRNMLIGDTISGVTRLAECLIWAGALACGFMITIM